MKFEIRRCGLPEYELILKMQEEVFKELFTQKCLHRNTPELLKCCLSDPHLTLGAFCVPERKNDENLSPKLFEAPTFKIPTFEGVISEASMTGSFDPSSRKLAAIGVLYVPDIENHFGSMLGFSEKDLPWIANMKLVIVLPEYRGNGLQKRLMNAVIASAKKRKFRGLYSTAHPENIYSIRNLVETGFIFQKPVIAYEEALSRNLYYREL